MEKEKIFDVVRGCITENCGQSNANLITWNSMWKDCQIGSSLEEFCVIMEIEKKLNISIPDEMVFKWLKETLTVGEIVDNIKILTNLKILKLWNQKRQKTNFLKKVKNL